MTLTLSPRPTSQRDKLNLNRAIKVASTGNLKHRHGAVIYKSGRVLSVGINSQRNADTSASVMPSDAYTVHAEQAAINALTLGRNCRVDLTEGATLYVVRINRAGDTMLSLPCSDCLIAITAAGIKRVVYSV